MAAVSTVNVFPCTAEDRDYCAVPVAASPCCGFQAVAPCESCAWLANPRLHITALLPQRLPCRLSPVRLNPLQCHFFIGVGPEAGKALQAALQAFLAPLCRDVSIARQRRFSRFSLVHCVDKDAPVWFFSEVITS